MSMYDKPIVDNNCAGCRGAGGFDSYECKVNEISSLLLVLILCLPSFVHPLRGVF